MRQLCMDRLDRLVRNVAISEHYSIRPLAYCDHIPLFDWTGDAKFNRGLLWSRPETVSEVAQYVSEWIDDKRVNAYAIVASFTGALQAIVLFKPWRDNLSSEMTLLVSPYRASGLGKLVTRKLSSAAHLAAPVLARTMTDSKAAQSVLNSAGFVYDHSDVITDRLGVMRAYYCYRLGSLLVRDENDAGPYRIDRGD